MESHVLDIDMPQNDDFQNIGEKCPSFKVEADLKKFEGAAEDSTAEDG